MPRNTKDINGYPSLKCMLQALLSLTCWPNQHDAWSFQGPKTVYISSTFSGLSKKETHCGTRDKCSTLLQSHCWCLPPVMAGSMDIENGLDRNAQESAEDLKCATETKSASQAIVGFSMAILAGPPTWYHLMLFCCSYCGVRVLLSGALFGTTFDLPMDLMNGVFGEGHSKHIMDTWNSIFLFFQGSTVFSSHDHWDFHCFMLWPWKSRFCRGLMKMIIWNMVKSSLLWWRWFFIAEGGGLKMQLDFRKK